MSSTIELSFNLILYVHLQAVKNPLSKQNAFDVVFSSQNIDSLMSSGCVRMGNDGYFKLMLLKEPMLLKSVREVSTEIRNLILKCIEDVLQLTTQAIIISILAQCFIKNSRRIEKQEEFVIWRVLHYGMIRLIRLETKH